MKRTIFLTLLLTCISLGIEAQTYTVFYLKGDVKCKHKGKITLLQEKQQVPANATFILEKDMALILKDEANYRLPVIKGPCSGQLTKLVKKEKATVLERSAEFFSHISGKSRSEVKSEADRMRQMGSISRQPIIGETPPTVPPTPNITPEEIELMRTSDEIERIIEELEN